MRAAIYCRISLDKDGGGEGVDRQLEDCRSLCRDRGWDEIGEYVDNDVSAFSGVKRPQFEEMLNDQHLYDTVVVWKSDRLARRGKDLQRFLDTGATLTSCTEPEFTGSTGLLMLRILAGFAEHESGVKSERVARKMRQKAERGDPPAGGRRAFGYSADGKRLDPAEAALIQEAARRILAGESLSHVLDDWTTRGIRPTGGGKRWSAENFKRLLRSPRLIGCRQLSPDGKTLMRGTFPAILDQATWNRLRIVLQVKKRSAPRKYLLTGLVRCGRCGAAMTGSEKGYRCQSPMYGGCGRITVNLGADDYVSRLALAALPSKDAERSPENQVDPLLDALRQTEADVAQLAKDHYVDHRISRPAYLAANDDLESRCQLLRSQIAEYQSGEDLGSLDDIVEQWEHQSVSWRQAVLRTVLERVEVSPATSTRQPVHERLRLVWRA